MPLTDEVSVGGVFRPSENYTVGGDWTFLGQVRFLGTGGMVGDVTAYGARGDGRTDDTRAIQAAIDAVAAAGGGTVHVPRGTYRVSALTVSTPGIAIHGTGATWLAKDDQSILTVRHADGFLLEGMTVDSQTRNGYVVDITQTAGFTVRRCRFVNLGNGTVQVIALYLGPNANDAVIEGNYFAHLAANEVARAVFLSNFRDLTKSVTGAKIVHNTFTDLTPDIDADGVVFDQLGVNARAVVAHNTFSQIGKRAVKAICGGVTIAHNRLTRTNLAQGTFAFGFYGNGNVIVGNTVDCVGCTYQAMVEGYGDECLIAHNVFRNPSGAADSVMDGVMLNGGGTYTSIAVVGNVMTRSRYGVRLTGGGHWYNVVVDSNVLIETQTGVWIDDFVERLTVRDNHMQASNYAVAFATAETPARTHVQIIGNTGTALFTPPIQLNLGATTPTGLRVMENAVAPALTYWEGAPTAATYGATVTVDARLATSYVVTATDGAAFTMAAPQNPVAGQMLTLRLKNASGGALGTVSWHGVFKIGTWTSPANGFSRSVVLQYDGTAWQEVARTPVDVPN